MPTDIASLGIEIKAEDIKKAVAELDRLEKQAGETEKATDGLTNKTKLMATAMGAAAVAAAAVLTRKIIDNTIAQQNAVAQLNAALKSTQNAAGLTSEELQNMAAQLQGVTTYGDETIITMQSVLLTFTKIGRETFPQATAAILDMSTRLGTDLKSSAIQVGKALNDPIQGITALSRVGVSFTEDQKNLIKSLAESGRMAEAQTLILKELETEFGGSAKAARQTLGGALESLSNTFGDLLEADDAGVNGFINAIEELNKSINDPSFKEGFSTLVNGLIKIAEVGTDAIAAVGDLAKQTSTTGAWFEAYQRGDISFFEWLTTGNEGAAARLAEINKGLFAITENLGVIQAFTNSGFKVIAKPETDQGTLPGLSEDEIAAIIERDKILYDMQLETERQALEDRELLRLEANERKRTNLLEHYSEEEEFAREKARRIAEIEEQEYKNQIQRGEGAFSTMLNNVAAHNKTFFKIQKVYRLSKLAMEAPAAIADSYAWGASWGGPPAGATMATIAGLAMAGYAQQLLSANYGGGGGAASSASTNAVTAPVTAGSTTLFPDNPNENQSRGSTTIIFNGDFIGTEEFVADKFIPLLGTLINEQDYVLIQNGSRQQGVIVG